MTVAELLRSSLRQIQITNPTSEELSHSMEALNLMLQEWATFRTGAFKLTRESFTISGGTSEYTIGPSQTFDTALPTRIGKAFVRENSIDYPLCIIPAEDYAEWADKTVQARPSHLFFERGVTTGTILLLSIPDRQYDLHLYSVKPLGAYTSTSQDLNLPIEYAPALKFKLAVELSTEFGVPLPATIERRAEETMRALKRLHSHPVPSIRTNPIGGFSRDTQSTSPELITFGGEGVIW